MVNPYAIYCKENISQFVASIKIESFFISHENREITLLKD